jgi:hypothetical protein
MLAVIGSGSGVWVAQSDAAGRFAGAHRLTSGSSTPQSVAATALSAGRSSVAWIAASAGGAATKILDAGGSLAHAPAHPHVAVRVPPGHEVDELALGPGPRGPTAGWVESWYDSAGSFHSEVAAADLAGRVRGRAFALAGQLAADVAVASDARGDSLLVWKACDRNAACAVYGASRAAGARFGAPQRLGAVDASQEPAAAIGARGQAIAGWIDNGHVFAAARGTARGRFGSPALVSGTNFAADLNLAFGPRGETIATWTQGTLAPSLMAAVHR